MAIDFDANAAVKEYFERSGWTIPDGDFFIITGQKVDSGGLTFNYPISGGNFDAVNSFNINITLAGIVNGNFRGASVTTGTMVGGVAINLDVYVYILLQRVGNNAFLRACYVNGSNIQWSGNPYLATAPVTGIGSISPTTLRLGGRTDEVSPGGSRWMNGPVSQLIMGTGTMTVNQFELIASGVAPNDPFLMSGLSLTCWIKDTGESGSAPSTLIDLSGNSRNFSLISGSPVRVANDSASKASNIFTASGSGVRAIYYNSPSNVQVKGKIATTASTDGASDAYGIWMRSGGAPYVVNNKVTLNAPAGFAISIGELGGSAISNASVLNNFVTSIGYPGSTPHGIAVRQNTSNSQVVGNTVENYHVGFLASLATSGTARANLFRRIFGPALYLKGVTNFLCDSNVIIVGDGPAMTNNGVLSAVYGETTDCSAGTFSNNIVIVKDRSKLKALAQIGGLFSTPSSPQPITLTNNVYIFPEEDWNPSENLFIYTGGISQNPNRTYAQWLTINSGGASVTGDRMIILPQAQINVIAAAYESGRASGLFKPLFN